jgi:hypothetical protein
VKPKPAGLALVFLGAMSAAMLATAVVSVSGVRTGGPSAAAAREVTDRYLGAISTGRYATACATLTPAAAARLALAARAYARSPKTTCADAFRITALNVPAARATFRALATARITSVTVRGTFARVDAAVTSTPLAVTLTASRGRWLIATTITSPDQTF